MPSQVSRSDLTSTPKNTAPLRSRAPLSLIINQCQGLLTARQIHEIQWHVTPYEFSDGALSGEHTAARISHARVPRATNQSLNFWREHWVSVFAKQTLAPEIPKTTRWADEENRAFQYEMQHRLQQISSSELIYESPVSFLPVYTGSSLDVDGHKSLYYQAHDRFASYLRGDPLPKAEWDELRRETKPNSSRRVDNTDKRREEKGYMLNLRPHATTRLVTSFHGDVSHFVDQDRDMTLCGRSIQSLAAPRFTDGRGLATCRSCLTSVRCGWLFDPTAF